MPGCHESLTVVSCSGFLILAAELATGSNTTARQIKTQHISHKERYAGLIRLHLILRVEFNYTMYIKTRQTIVLHSHPRSYNFGGMVYTTLIRN